MYHKLKVWNIKRLACLLSVSTNCRRAAATICLRPCKLTMSSYLFARWHLFRHVGYLRHQHQVDLWPFDLESGVRITWDVGYLCANFSLPRPLRSRVRPTVRDRQTSDAHHRLMPQSALYGGGGIIIVVTRSSQAILFHIYICQRVEVLRRSRGRSAVAPKYLTYPSVAWVCRWRPQR